MRHAVMLCMRIRLLRLEYLPAVIGPQLIGYVIAWHALQQPSSSSSSQRLPLYAALSPWLLLRLCLSVLALMLMWCGSLLLNDCCDVPADRVNPRRKKSPLITGEVSVCEAMCMMATMKTVALIIALAVSPAFFIVLLGLAVLSWLYSAPPLRLKGCPGLDVALNAISVGAMCTLSGWTIEAPILSFPWLFLLPVVLGWVSLYVPTTMWDAGADKSCGVETFAVRVGMRAAFWVSLVCMVAAQGLTFAMAAAGYVFSPTVIPWIAPWAVLQVVAFVYFCWGLKPRQLVRGTFISAALGLVLEIFLVLHLVGAMDY